MKAISFLVPSLTVLALGAALSARPALAVAPALVEGTATGFTGILLVKTYRATRMWAVGACTNFNVISKKAVPRYSKTETKVMNHKGIVSFKLPTHEERTKTSGTCAWKLESVYLKFTDKADVDGSVSLYAEGDTSSRGPLMTTIRRIECRVKPTAAGLGMACGAPAEGITNLSHMIYRDGDTNTVMQFAFSR